MLVLFHHRCVNSVYFNLFTKFSHIKYIHNFPTSSMYNHKFTLVSRKTMDVKMLSILMNKIQIDSIYFSWYFPLSGVILGMMRVSTIYILYQHYISSMTWSLFRHYSWKIEKWTDDSMRFLFTTTAFTETCTGWIFSCCLMLINSLTVWAQVQVHRRPGHRRGDRAQEAQ